MRQVNRPDPTDPGELRRQRLLRKAQKDAEARLDRRQMEDQAKRRSNNQTRIDDDQCMEMGRQLDILQYQMPVYLDEQGKYRVKWAQDTCAGSWRYIDDARRASVAKSLEKRIEKQCSHQDADARKGDARGLNYRAEKCAAAMVELESVEDPTKRAVGDEIEDARREVQFFCS